MKISEKCLKQNCILISEFRKCGFGTSNLTCFYKSASYIGLFKQGDKFIVYTRIISSDIYEYDNYKDAHAHYKQMIEDIA